MAKREKFSPIDELKGTNPSFIGYRPGVYSQFVRLLEFKRKFFSSAVYASAVYASAVYEKV
jgi:hypothetical protein